MTEEYFDDINDLIKKANTNQEISVSDTSQQQQQRQEQEEEEEDDNAYYRDQIIARENERYTPRPVQKGNDKNEAKQEEQEEIDEIISRLQVYKLGNHFLAEAVLIGEANQPYWIAYDSLVGTVSVKPFIDISDEEGEEKKHLYPPNKSGYLNQPYVFESVKEINELVQDVRAIETPETLFTQINRQWKKYVNESENHINVCAGDCVFTYFQDRLGSTHYLFFIADTEAGKTTNLQLFAILAYRAFLGIDISTANIYRFYGNEYEGTGTLLEDELENLDEQPEKFRIYKSGHRKGVKVPKSERASDSLHFEQEGYNTYGFKAFAAEKMPSSFRAKGFKERTIPMPCSFGYPEINLDDVLDNADDPMYKPLLKELYDLRNRLLIYRIVHYFDPIPVIDTGLKARERQLWNPLLRVFQNQNSQMTFEILKKVAKEFIKESRRLKSHTHTAFLLNVIIELELEHKSLTLATSDIWKKYKDMLPEGEETAKTSYRSAEFGDMSQKKLNEMLQDQFKARPPKHTGNKRELIFDKMILDRMKEKYGIKIDNNQPETDETDESDETDVSLDKHMSEQNSDTKTNEKTEENSDYSQKEQEKQE